MTVLDCSREIPLYVNITATIGAPVSFVVLSWCYNSFKSFLGGKK